MDATTSAELHRARAHWYELDAHRPAMFPVLIDKRGTTLPKEVAEYLKSDSSVAAQRAQVWLDVFENAPKFDG